MTAIATASPPGLEGWEPVGPAPKATSVPKGLEGYEPVGPAPAPVAHAHPKGLEGYQPIGPATPAPPTPDLSVPIVDVTKMPTAPPLPSSPLPVMRDDSAINDTGQHGSVVASRPAPQQIIDNQASVPKSPPPLTPIQQRMRDFTQQAAVAQPPVVPNRTTAQVVQAENERLDTLDKRVLNHPARSDAFSMSQGNPDANSSANDAVKKLAAFSAAGSRPYTPEYDVAAAEALAALDKVQSDNKLYMATHETRSGLWNSVDKLPPAEEAYTTMKGNPTEENQRRFADSLVRGFYGDDPAATMAQRDAEALTRDRDATLEGGAPLAARVLAAPTKDRYGNVVTPQAELAARLIVEKGGWEKMNPTDRKKAMQLMDVASGVRSTLNKPSAVDDSDPTMAGRVIAATEQFGRAAQIPGIDMTGGDPIVAREYNKIQQKQAEDYPLAVGGGNLAGSIANPVYRAGGDGLGKVLKPLIGETAGGMSALGSGSLRTFAKTAAQSSIENAAFGGGLALTQQVIDGHIEPNEVLQETLNQAKMGPLFHFTIGAGMEGLNQMWAKRDQLPPTERQKFDAALAKVVQEHQPAPSPQSPAQSPTPAAPAPEATPHPVATIHPNSPNVKRITRPDGGWEKLPQTPPPSEMADAEIQQAQAEASARQPKPPVAPVAAKDTGAAAAGEITPETPPQTSEIAPVPPVSGVGGEKGDGSVTPPTGATGGTPRDITPKTHTAAELDAMTKTKEGRDQLIQIATERGVKMGGPKKMAEGILAKQGERVEPPATVVEDKAVETPTTTENENGKRAEVQPDIAVPVAERKSIDLTNHDAKPDPQQFDKYARPTERYEWNGKSQWNDTESKYESVGQWEIKPVEFKSLGVKDRNPANPKDAARIIDAYNAHLKSGGKRSEPAPLDVDSLDAVNAAYRATLKEVTDPTGHADEDLKLWALPGKEKAMDEIARKMRRAKAVNPYELKMANPMVRNAKGVPMPAKDVPGVISSIAVGASRMPTRYANDGIFIDKGGKTAVSTDGHRMFIVMGDKAFGKPGVWRIGKAGVLGEKIEGSFPPYSDVIPKKNVRVGNSPIDVASTLGRLRQVEVMTGTESKGVLVMLNKDGTLGFAARDPGEGGGIAEVGVNEGAKELGGINPAYFIEALEFHAKMGAKEVDAWWEKPSKPLLIEGRSNAAGQLLKHQSVTMPVNTEEGGYAHLHAALVETPEAKAESRRVGLVNDADKQITDLQKEIRRHQEVLAENPSGVRREWAEKAINENMDKVGELQKQLEALQPKEAAVEPEPIVEPVTRTGDEAKIAEKFKGVKSGELLDGGKSEGPGAAATSDPTAFRPETNGYTVTPKNAPKVVSATHSPAATTAREAMTLSNIIHKSYEGAKGAVRDGYNAISDSVRRYAQISFPALTRDSRAAGEAAATLSATREIIKHQSASLASEVLGHAEAKPGDAFDQKLGTVLVEDQLRGIRQKFIDRGDQDAADAVKTLVGAPDSPLKTEADYKAALEDTKIQVALAAHRQFVEPVTEENYRLSAKIDPEIETPARGRDTNSHVSLKAIRDEAEEAYTSKSLKQGGNIRNTLEKHSPFEREARGNAKQYETSYSELVKNSIEKGTLPAAQARLYKALQDDGLAVEGKAGTKPTIDGRPTVAFDTKLGKIILPKEEGGEAFGTPGRKLYIRADKVPEVRAAMKIDQPDTSRVLKPLAGLNTQITLTSGVEGIAHAANHFAVMFKEPIKGQHLPTWFVNIPGVPKVAGILDAVGTKAYGSLVRNPEVQRQLSQLSQIGALKPEHETIGLSKYNPTTYLMAKPIEHLARASRLVLNDSYQMLVDRGFVEDTPTARRDFVNQVGQYHKEAQNSIVRVMRNIGAADFATAGATFYTQGIRTLTASPGVKGATPGRGAALRFYVAAQLAGTLAQVALVNYLQTGKIQPPGTPWGSLYLYQKDDGRDVYVDVADIIGAKRGARATGIDSLIEGKRKGAPASQIADKGAKQGSSAAISPLIGPGLSTVITAIGGYSPHGLYDTAGRAKPGESQAKRNLAAAAKEINPTASGIIESMGRGDDASDFAAGQFGKFGPRTGPSPVYSRLEVLRNKKGDKSIQGREVGELSMLESAVRQISLLRKMKDKPNAVEYIDKRIKELERVAAERSREFQGAK